MSNQLSNQIFHPFFYLAEEDDLAKTIKDFQVSGFPLTINWVCQLAFQFAYVNNIPGFSEKNTYGGEKMVEGFFKASPRDNIENCKKFINRTCNGSKRNCHFELV